MYLQPSWLMRFFITPTIKQMRSGYAVAIIFFSVVRILVANDYLTNNRYALQKYLYAHLFLTLVIGTFWALSAFLLHQPADESVRNIFYLINFGLISGSIATLSTYGPPTLFMCYLSL